MTDPVIEWQSSIPSADSTLTADTLRPRTRSFWDVARLPQDYNQTSVMHHNDLSQFHQQKQTFLSLKILICSVYMLPEHFILLKCNCL